MFQIYPLGLILSYSTSGTAKYRVGLGGMFSDVSNSLLDKILHRCDLNAAYYTMQSAVRVYR